MMELNTYQNGAQKTAIYQHGAEQLANGLRGEIADFSRLAYTTMKLSGEAGEVVELVAKAIRDDDGRISEERREALKKELGDALWYVALCAYELGFTLDDIADTNLSKLLERQQAGKLQGSGSDR